MLVTNLLGRKITQYGDAISTIVAIYVDRGETQGLAENPDHALFEFHLNGVTLLPVEEEEVDEEKCTCADREVRQGPCRYCIEHGVIVDRCVCGDDDPRNTGPCRYCALHDDWVPEIWAQESLAILEEKGDRS